MSRVLEHRQRVMDAIKDSIPDLLEVDWYDGLFDTDDIKQWIAKSPSAYVSVRRVPTAPHSTGELNATLRVITSVVVEDEWNPRDADEKCWQIIEAIAILASNNLFGDPNAGVPCKIRFERLSVPELRRNGVAVGVAEWEVTVTIGRNMVKEREFFHHPTTGEELPVPVNLDGQTHLYGSPVAERVNITPQEDDGY